MAELERIYTPHIRRAVWLRKGTSDQIVWGDTFTGRYHLPPDSMPEPATVLDLGSNIGLTLADYRHRWPRAKIVGVEMDEANAALARRNEPSATIVRAAVAGAKGRRYYDAMDKSFAMRLTSAELPEGRAVAVEARSLGSLLHSEFAGSVDFVKMDVEGAEWELFEDEYWAPGVRHLLVELHADPRPGADDLSLHPPAELVSRAGTALRALGFDVRHHEPHPAAVWATR